MFVYVPPFSAPPVGVFNSDNDNYALPQINTSILNCRRGFMVDYVLAKCLQMAFSPE